MRCTPPPTGSMSGSPSPPGRAGNVSVSRGPLRPAAPRRRNATSAINPPTPHAATTTTSVQLNGVPMNPAWRPGGKVVDREDPGERDVTQAGAPLPSGIKIPDRKSSGRIVALTIAGALSALGISEVTATPRAQKLVDPTTTITRNRTECRPGRHVGSGRKSGLRPPSTPRGATLRKERARSLGPEYDTGSAGASHSFASRSPRSVGT